MENFPLNEIAVSSKNEITNENTILTPKGKETNDKKENDNLSINKEKQNIRKDRAKYIAEVKKYLNFNVKDFEYEDIIKNKSDCLFETLKESTIMKWEIKLFNNFSYVKTTTDEMIESIKVDVVKLMMNLRKSDNCYI